MRLCLAQMNSVPADKERNVQRAVELIEKAAKEKSDLIVLPEFFNVEYFPQYRDYKYLDYAEALDGPSLKSIAAAAEKHNVWIVATIFEKNKPGHYYDSAVLFNRQGKLSGVYRKTHPAAVYSLEKIYFRYGSHFPVFKVEGWKVGIMICYDTMFPEVARILAIRGAELIIAPFARPRDRLWREINIIRAFENGCFLATCNKVGKEGDWELQGESTIVSPSGEVMGVASSEEDDLVIRDLDQEQVDICRKHYPFFRDRRPDSYSTIVEAQEDF